MSNIRRVTKSTNCVDCYNNNPFQQNEGLKSYAKMISNHTNTESCKSCEPCYDPYLKKVFTEGCLTGEGTECNPLSIDLDCIPSGGVSSCTVITPDCCDYILENIVFGQVCIEFLKDSYDFSDEETIYQVTIGVSKISGGTDQSTFNIPSNVYTKQEFIDLVYENWTIEANISTIEKTATNICITITKPTSIQMGITIPFDATGSCDDYSISGTYNITNQGDCISEFNYNLAFGTKFQVNINDSWTDLTENALEGTWESICDTRDITSYRILDEDNDVLYSGNLEPQDCRGGGEQITKSICDWIDYLYNQTSNPSSNECTLTSQNCNQLFSIEILQEEFLAVLPSNVFVTENFFIEYSTNEQSYRLTEANVILNEGENTVITSDIISNLFNNWTENNFFNIVREGNKLVLTSKSCLEGFIYFCTSNFGNVEDESITVTPSFIENVEVKINSETIQVSIIDGKLYWITSLVNEETTETKSFCDWISYLYNEVSGVTSGENIYNANGTLLSNRTLEGDDKTLFFQNLRSFGVEAQPQDNDTYGIALGNNQGGSPLSLAGIILGGVGKNKGVQISGITTGDDGAGTSAIQITGENSNALANDLVFDPQNGRLKISNLPTDNTALQVASKDSNDRLVWRDVSSIGSTLPSNVCQMIGIDFTKTTTTTNAADQVIGHVLIPANTFGSGSSLIEVESCITRLVAGANPNHRLFINTSTSFSGATLIATINVTTALKYSKGERTFECGTNFIRGLSFTGATGIDDLGSSYVISQATIDWGVNQYILTTINNTTGETTQHELTSVELKKV